MSRRTQQQLVEHRFADIRTNRAQKGFNWGFSDKTGWDWLDLLAKLAIPIVVLGATILFGWRQVQLADIQHQTDQKLAQQQHTSDQQSALDQQRASILQTYIDNIQDLLLNHNLHGSKQNNDIAILAQARTLTALQGLDPERKGRLLIFLYETDLIGFDDTNRKTHDPIIDLSSANLSEAELLDANLSGVKLLSANLSGANLSGANLSDVILLNATLNNATLNNTDLFGAELFEANLNNAILRKANLNNADLDDAILNNTNLSGAYLNGTYLSGANLNGAYLSGAEISQKQLDQVYSCTGAILPPGLTCHHNQSVTL